MKYGVPVGNFLLDVRTFSHPRVDGHLHSIQIDNVRGSRDLEGARVAMDADPRCVRALGMDKRLGFPDLEGLRLAMDADPRGILAIGDQNIGTRTWGLFLLTFPIPEEQGWRDPQTDWRPEA